MMQAIPIFVRGCCSSSRCGCSWLTTHRPPGEGCCRQREERQTDAQGRVAPKRDEGAPEDRAAGCTEVEDGSVEDHRRSGAGGTLVGELRNHTDATDSG